MKRLLALMIVAAAVTACAEPRSFIVARPEDKRVDAAVTAMWAHEIHGIARDGDWVLTRSYYALGDAIALATPGDDPKIMTLATERRPRAARTASR